MIDQNIRALYKSGLSLSKIGAQVGITRNAVAHRIRRMIASGDIISRTLTTNEKQRKTAASNNALIVHRVKNYKRRELIDIPEISFGTPVDIISLNNHTCRYPLPGNLYCGAETHKRDYCKGHYDLCFYVRRAV